MAEVRDPVCNTAIDSVSAASKTSYQGRNYYFCSDDCASQFQSSPGKYAAPEASVSHLRREAERRLDGR